MLRSSSLFCRRHLPLTPGHRPANQHAHRLGQTVLAEHVAHERGKLPLVARIDADGGGHARAQWRVRIRGHDLQVHGDPLDHLDPVSRGVLRGENGEFGTFIWLVVGLNMGLDYNPLL